ncbi:MAG TPA: response regulator [Anaerolineales bacterium]|nr:response regulator [Anaerolineales bacterium]
MASTRDRILLVENDPQIIDVIAQQALRSVGYHVDVVEDSSAAIKSSLETPPDLIIVDLNIPGLSAKDMLVALTAQGVNTPLLVIASKGQEQDVIQAFRLGAADYLLWPARDAEVVSVVERVLQHVHELHDRQRLGLKLNETNQELQRTARELNAIINIGKAVISTPDQRALFQKIVDGAVQVAEANMAWLLIRHEESKTFLLSAQRGLPRAWSAKMNTPLDDGLSGLVALSGETLAIAGDALTRFRIANLGKSACAVPIKVQTEVIGMLLVVRREEREFERLEQTVLEAVAVYAAISLVNARLFQALHRSVQASKEAQQQQNTLLEAIRNSVTEELHAATDPIDRLLTLKQDHLSSYHRQALQTARVALQRLARVAENTPPPVPIKLKKQ